MIFYQTMTIKIDFYLAKQTNFRDCHPLCHQLISDNYASRKNLYIKFSGLDDAEWYNERLWNYQPQDFIPHTLAQDMIAIKIERPNSDQPYTQCNLQVTNENILSQVNHLIQIVPNNELDKQKARELYKKFQQLGYQITVHKDA
jgi:DNA polymerase-3 subunit chi